MDFANYWFQAPAGGGGAVIGNSLRFRKSAYLHRAPFGAGTESTTWTLSMWFKRGWIKMTDGTYQNLVWSGSPSGITNTGTLWFFYDDRYPARQDKITSVYSDATTVDMPGVQRDPSAWYHLVVKCVGTTGNSGMVTYYLNGVEQVSRAVPEAYMFGPPRTPGIGARGNNGDSPFDGYMAEIHYVHGTAPAVTDFGEFNADGVWVPKTVSGVTYGTNGFYLDFSDAADIGADRSGNGNNWTPTGFELANTSSTSYDWMADSPTKNWCTLNPLKLGADATLGDGNLVATVPPAANVRWNGTIAMSPGSGKYYAEMTVTQTNNYGSIGLSSIDDPATGELTTGYLGFNGYYGATPYGASYTTGDVIGIAYDAINGALYFSKNGTFQNSGDPTSGATATGAAVTGLTGTYVVGGGLYGGVTGIYTLNFGQRPFAHTPPTGYKTLSTNNLPEPTIKDGSQYFNTVLYTGNNTTHPITGVGFAPDFVWIKPRNFADHHRLNDKIRGVNKTLSSNLTAAEYGPSNAYLDSFDSDGFTISGSNVGWNNSSYTYVAWNWLAGGTGSSNTDGSITSTVSANPTAGFSIVTYSGQTTNFTWGHGLGVPPSMVIIKRRNTAAGWSVYHKSLGATKRLQLDQTGGEETMSYFQNAEPTDTVFSVTTNGGVGADGDTYVAYCFAEVEGYSKFGSYTGNGSSDGPFIATSFAVAWVMVKRSDGGAEPWVIMDNERPGYNPSSKGLYANAADAENDASGRYKDLLSNGFKVRGTSGEQNSSGATYIYMAFAEHPFGGANVSPSPAR